MVHAHQPLLTVRVVRIAREAPDVCVFELHPEPGTALPPFEPGAHIDVHIRPGVIRQYSLCGDPSDLSSYRLGVKLNAASRGGSRAMHAAVQVGTALQVSAPRNLFPLAREAQHHVLLAGGIGVTPMLSMVPYLARAGASFEFHYFTRSDPVVPFGDLLATSPYAERARVYENLDPSVTSAAIQVCLGRGLPLGTHIYTCGPDVFMNEVRRIAALHLPGTAFHQERFQASDEPSAGMKRAFRVELVRSGRVFDVSPDQSIVDVLEANGIACDSSCRQGICGTCVTPVLEGNPEHRDEYLSDAEKERGDTMCICVSRARSEVLRLDL